MSCFGESLLGPVSETAIPTIIFLETKEQHEESRTTELSCQKQEEQSCVPLAHQKEKEQFSLASGNRRLHLEAAHKRISEVIFVNNFIYKIY